MGVVAAGLVVALLLGACGSDDSPEPAAEPAPFEPAVWAATSSAEAVRIDPETGDIVATVPVGEYPLGIAAGAGSIWTVDRDSDTVTRIDPAANEVIATIEVAGVPSSIAADDANVWVKDSVAAKLHRIDVSTNEVVDSFDLPEASTSPEVLGGSAWVAGSNAIIEIDPDTGETSEVEVGRTQLSLSSLAVAGGKVWVGDDIAKELFRLDPATGEVVTSKVETGPVGSSFFLFSLYSNGDDQLWMAVSGDALIPIDVATGKLGEPVPSGGIVSGGAAFMDGFAWTGYNDEDTVFKIDTDAGEVVDEISVFGVQDLVATE